MVWQSRLTVLQADQNRLSGQLPPALSTLQNLQELTAGHNYFGGGLPEELGKLLALHSLLLWEDFLTGAIPDAIGQMQYLDWLVLDANQFQGALPAELGNLRLLSGLLLTGARSFKQSWLFGLDDDGEDGELPALDGPLPEAVEKLRNLRRMELEGQALAGTYPAAIGALRSLEALTLDSNELEGAIPAAMGSLQKLGQWAAAENSLKGTLPDALRGLQSVSQVHLDSNHFEGSLPASIGLWRVLTALGLKRNFLTGWLPEGVGELRALTWFMPLGNRLSGPLPEGIWKLKLLDSLYLCANRFRGTVSDGVGALAQLQELALYENALEGILPDSVSHLRNALSLDVSKNRMSGSLPVSLAEMRRLMHLVLSQNQFAGTVSDRLLQSTHLITFDVGNNRLAGEVPAALGSLTQIKVLSLLAVHWEGQVPASIPRMGHSQTRWDHLMVSLGHGLSGSLPPLVATLRILSVHGNGLEGKLPPLAAASSRGRILAHNNRFSCRVPSLRSGEDLPFSCVLVGNCFMVGAASGTHLPTWISEQEQSDMFYFTDRHSVHLLLKLLAGAALLSGLTSSMWLHMGWTNGLDARLQHGRSLALRAVLGVTAVCAAALALTGAILLLQYLGVRGLACMTVFSRLHFPIKAEVQVALSQAMWWIGHLWQLSKCAHCIQRWVKGSAPAARLQAVASNVLPVNLKPYWFIVITWFVWLLVTLLLAVPGVLYSTVRDIPGVVRMSGLVSFLINNGMSLLSVLLISFVLPKFARVLHRQSKKFVEEEELLAYGKLLTTWFLPALVTLGFHDMCFGAWMTWWRPCSAAPSPLDITVWRSSMFGGSSETDDLIEVSTRANVCTPRLRSTPRACITSLVERFSHLIIGSALHITFMVPFFQLLRGKAIKVPRVSALVLLLLQLMAVYSTFVPILQCLVPVSLLVTTMVLYHVRGDHQDDLLNDSTLPLKMPQSSLWTAVTCAVLMQVSLLWG